MADKFALVTGASGGIGYLLAQELASRGYHLIVCSGGDRLESAAEEMRGYGVDVVEVDANLATRKGVEELWDWVKSSGHKLDVACLNPGDGVNGLFKDIDLESELNMVEQNCAGTVQLAKYVVRDMAERGEGRILFTAAIDGEMIAPREAVYAATKAFVLSFAHSLRSELEGGGVTVSTLQTEPIDTTAGQELRSDSKLEEAAHDGIDALMAGKDFVSAASMKTKLGGMLSNVIPGKAKAAVRDKQAKSIDSTKESETGSRETERRNADQRNVDQRNNNQRKAS